MKHLVSTLVLLVLGVPSSFGQNCSFHQVDELLPPTPNPRFGRALAIDGELLVVGETGTTAPGFRSLGVVRLYEQDPVGPAGGWSLAQTLVSSDRSSGADFGTAVAVEHDRILVGDPTAGSHGRVYVFERDAVSGLFEERDWLDPGPSPPPGLRTFGERLALSGDTVAVAFRQGLVGSGSADTAVVSIYEVVEGRWGRIQNLVSPEPQDKDGFASDLDLEGARLAVGARWGSDGSGNKTGAVHVFEREGTESWDFVDTLLAADGVPFDWFGASVSLSGDRILTGARRNSHSGFSGAGAAYVFEFDGSAWSQVAKLVASNPGGQDWFGTDVALFDERALVGSPFAGAGRPGFAYLFLADAGGLSAWGEVALASAARPTPFGGFGSLLDLGERFALVGLDVGSNAPRAPSSSKREARARSQRPPFATPEATRAR